MSKSQFDKFTAKKNSAIKEGFKQAKRKAKKEKSEAINKRFEEKRQMKAAIYAQNQAESSKRTDTKDKKDSSFKPKEQEVIKKENASTETPNRHLTRQQPALVTPKEKKTEQPKTDFSKYSTEKPKVAAKRKSSEKIFNSERAVTKPKPIEKNYQSNSPATRVKIAPVANKPERKAESKPTDNTTKNQPTRINEMPLNKFVAHCGVCSRRDAVGVIKDGKIRVNNEVITEPAFKVNHEDNVTFNNKRLNVSKNMVYILLNKPKDYITTTDDPQGRKTVLQLTKMATTERVYPVGRLDRNTSGVLLLTNDGELTQKLSHPSYNITKVYEVRLDKPLTKAHFDEILNGLQLEDGEIKADTLAYADAKDKSIIGIEIHSGRNRIVRRIFEHLGYDVKGLDRVMYATLTKKNVDRGKWRFLSEKEVRLLKYLNKSKTPAKKNDQD